MRQYKIGDKIYIQRPLVIGQVRQLLSVLEGIQIPSDVDVMGLVATLGDRLPDALAVILTPVGTHPKEKDLKAISDEIAFSLELETAMKVIEDFFVLNPISSLFERMGKMVEAIQAQFQTQSMNSFVSSQEETSQKETQSNGDTHSKSANDTSNIENGK